MHFPGLPMRRIFAYLSWEDKDQDSILHTCHGVIWSDGGQELNRLKFGGVAML